MSSDRLTRKEIKEDIRKDEVQHFLGDLVHAHRRTADLLPRPARHRAGADRRGERHLRPDGLEGRSRQRRAGQGDPDLQRADRGARTPSRTTPPSRASRTKRPARPKPRKPSTRSTAARPATSPSSTRPASALQRATRSRPARSGRNTSANHQGDAVAMTVRTQPDPARPRRGQGPGAGRPAPEGARRQRQNPARRRPALPAGAHPRGPRPEGRGQEALPAASSTNIPTSAFTGDARRVTTAA